MIFDDFFNYMGQFRRNGEVLLEHIIRKDTSLQWDELLKSLEKTHCVQGYFCCKVMYSYTAQISNFIQHGTWKGVELLPDFKPELFDAFYQAFSSAIWVYVERADICSQAVSLYMAESTNVWEKLNFVPKAGIVNIPSRPNIVPAELVQFDFERLKRYVCDIQRETEQWQRFFSYYKISPLRIRYEDAISSYPHYLDELMEAAQLKKVDQPQPRRMSKLGGEQSQLWADRLREEMAAEKAALERAAKPKEDIQADLTGQSTCK